MTRDDVPPGVGTGPTRTGGAGRRPTSDGGEADWRVLESVAEYETGWYTGGYDEVAQPDGSTKRYYWAALPPAVVVVPLLDDEVVFVEQYRPAIREHCLELPAGIVERVEDPNDEPAVGDGTDSPATDEPDSADLAAVTETGRESYEAAGARELREEAGYEPAELTRLETVWCSTGVLRHRRAYVVAEGLEPVGRDLDSNEFLTVARRSRDEALDLARSRPANDATLEALLLASADGHL